LHIPTVCYAIVIATSILGGAFVHAFNSKTGLFMLAFTLWLVIDIPFSVWRGGSFQLVIENWPKSLMLFIAMAGLAATLPHCRLMMQSSAYATGVLAIISVVLVVINQERLFIVGEKFANPNDLAQALLIGLPFWWFMARNPGRTPFRGLISVAFIGFILYVLSKTGSRGGLFALGAMLLILFWNASPIGKLSLVIACLVFGVLGYVLLPKSLLNRYATFSKADTEDTLEVIAAASAESRVEVLKESVRLTLTHPIFGVGPGMFTVASADRAREQGRRSSWIE